ncbi:PhzF family phenazine biosynthesis protein [Yinghuangia soli]|uniref:PhzF family phenazine biosynthesis isomerase n=1 Tax=Yinghuangia soli TaxID=2908204 RepID=A0AA41Q4V0_9ACTN|nr:PhzF family phenazine biosynthesis isomerase [Yinghuangia soli]MCF2531371.1 PhzF family phenazine biosynthesis isomerase [Yinghuangia soli]
MKTSMSVEDLQVTIVDACLRDGTGGSPTAVLDERALSDEQRRRVPVLAGTSHAVFVSRPQDGSTVATLRFFTRDGELPACGHGTVAALAFLAESRSDNVHLEASGRAFDGWVRGGRETDTVEAAFDPGAVDLRAATEPELTAVRAALGLDGDGDLDDAVVASIGRPRLLVQVKDRSVLDSLAPDFARLREACDRFGFLGCYVYVTPGPDGRTAARMFAPSIGVPEDIANANSTACLAAYMAGRGINRIAVDMGDSLGSPATITATADATEDTGSPAVRLGGVARVGRVVRLPLP